MVEGPLFEFEFKQLSEEFSKHLKEKLLEIRQIEWVSYDAANRRLCVKSSIPIHELHTLLIQLSKSQVVIVGMGEKYDAAIVQLFDYQKEYIEPKGVIKIVQLDESNCLVDGVVSGLEKDDHEMVLFENGDLSDKLNNLGNKCSLLPTKNDILKISVDANNRSEFSFAINSLKIENLFGRSIFICKNNEKICGGIVARSSKVFDNFKKICLCNGSNIWSEKQA
uniref:Cu/Zn superoxide dismutase n=1 Tax=Brachionus plicatilis TaxID=10195 RepID=A0A7L7YYA8_BRAPC|nr:Cu/Zn superoxide dismutase [Brachionus plicatilis]